MEVIKPFVKWAGGKGSLISQLTNFYPFELENGTIKKYVEPFVGGGAVLIDILQKYDSTSPLIFGKIELAEDPSLIGKIALFKRVTKVPALERLYIQKQDLIATITNEEYNDIIFSKE
jgi:hypothetical protein